MAYDKYIQYYAPVIREEAIGNENDFIAFRTLVQNVQ
jgi:hypothetical protein